MIKKKKENNKKKTIDIYIDDIKQTLNVKFINKGKKNEQKRS